MMGTKTVSIREDVYDMLKGLKRDQESFSDVISKLTKKKGSDIGGYFGILKTVKYWMK